MYKNKYTYSYTHKFISDDTHVAPSTKEDRLMYRNEATPPGIRHDRLDLDVVMVTEETKIPLMPTSNPPEAEQDDIETILPAVDLSQAMREHGGKEVDKGHQEGATPTPPHADTHKSNRYSHVVAFYI